MSEQVKETGLAKRSFTLMPSSLGEAREMADLIANSDFAPKDYKGKPANVIIAVQMGADLGLKPMQALQNIAVINGKPSIYGDGALALVLAAGVLEDFKEFYEGEGDETTAVCEAKRKGMSVTRNTFSVKDAKAANLWGKQGPWSHYWKRMLKFRARGFTLRDVASDILLGLILAEEAMDYPDAIDTHAVSVEEVVKPVDLMEKVPEGMRENVEKAFGVLNFAPGQRHAKLNEFIGAKDSTATAEERTTALLEWCRDEFARRKNGKPRAAKDSTNGNAKKAQEPTKAAEPVQAAPAEKSSPAPVVAPQEVKEAELMPDAPSVNEIPFGNQGQNKTGEWF